MVDFEMPLKDGGYISYKGQSNIILIEDDDCSRVKIDADELIRFTNTNFWKHLSKQSIKEG